MHREMLPALPKLVGKTIAHVVMKEGRSPAAQLFLVFTDGTSYELFSQCSIDGGAGLDAGGLAAVLRYGDPVQATVFQC